MGETESEKFAYIERVEVYRRMRRGKGKEVSSLGHVSHTLESPQGRGAGVW